MENYKNSKNPFSNMKRLIMIMLLLFISINSVSAGTIIYNQTNVINDFEKYQYNTKLVEVLVGNTNNEAIGSYTGDYKIELRDITNDVYFIYDNGVPNSYLNITWFSAVDNSNIATQQQVILNEVGEYYFKFERAYNFDSGDIMFDIADSQVGNFYVVFAEGKAPADILDQTKSNLYENLIGYVIDLIIINIAIWRLGFYLAIGVIIIGSIVLIVLWTFKFYEWAKTQDIWNHTKRKNSRR